MNKSKVTLDRKKLSSDYIYSKQNFQQIINQVHLKKQFNKSAWFYGTIGLASLAFIILLGFANSF